LIVSAFSALVAVDDDAAPDAVESGLLAAAAPRDVGFFMRAEV
jgi:hypothetical protein